MTERQYVLVQLALEFWRLGMWDTPGSGFCKQMAREILTQVLEELELREEQEAGEVIADANGA